MSSTSKRWCLHLHILLFLLCGVFPSLYAQPKYVYRFDFRPPEVIFSSGFTARGHNRDLLRHVAFWAGDSAFIATTESYEVALRIARGHLRGPSDLTGYIYTISANPTFYPVTASLEGFLDRGRAEGIDQEHFMTAAAAQAAMEELRWEQEYVAAGPIWARWIHSAKPVDIVRGARGRIEVYERPRVLNSGWGVSEDDRASLLPYPMTWPVSDHAMPVCAATIHELEDLEDLENLEGEDCAGDLWMAMDGDEYIHPAMLASCDLSRKEKRSAGERACSEGPRLLNASKRVRAHAAGLLFSGDEELSGRVHDEL